ncbi:hypothetical protein NSK_005788 [Nannochloropsis salina CCMP1776]|uniref:Effector protein n=1 Tax=Nannochloropsis salina CCMP1776 TaxID=1027361 RepID=A0A4D9D2T1_9STRA|nr:hypothetical protein NSK_005788 [Nannochloropsis salina CCMP1776]|eukprot:TFJ82909.1 hypothetical protein NSK_005788 [Nannochloropsis salina CCMP1776]
MKFLVFLVVATATIAHAFVLPRPPSAATSSLPISPALYAAMENDTPSTDDSQATPPPSKKAFKGFGEKPQKREPPPKTKGQVEREKYASAYDSLASKGVPEYAVYIREREGGEKDWKFVGSMAVPRNAKIDQAIYENEPNLIKGAYKLHPKLVGKEKESFVYGFNLKKFPDEPIKLAVKPAEGSGNKNPVIGWLENVMNPLDASNVRG